MKKRIRFRRFKSLIPMHVFQRSKDWGVIFYDDVYILKHFILVMVLSVKYDITIYGLTYMLNHWHLFAAAALKSSFSKFMDENSSRHSRNYNRVMHRKGHVFERVYGSSLKWDTKQFRSTHNYLANNPVEKGIVRKAIAYKWNFLAYANEKYPFSKDVTSKDLSEKYRKYETEITKMSEALEVPKIQSLISMKRNLTAKEWRRLVDHIISSYNRIDYSATAEYFDGNIHKMQHAPDMNTGSEYDLPDDLTPYGPYYAMLKRIQQEIPLYDWNPYAMSDDDILEWVQKLSGIPGVTRSHFEAIFHRNLGH